MYSYKPVVIILIIVLGLSLGSFINALVWRLHIRDKSKKYRRDDKFSILKGRSMCPDCHHELKAADLIPVFSWLMLKGKCRYCHKPISPSYPIVEALTCGLFIFSYVYWPLTFNSQGVFYLVVWLALLVNLIALALYDLRWMTLPNKIIYPLFGLVGLQILVTVIFYDARLHYLLNSLVGLLVGGGIFYLLFQISGGKWIGGGDVKLGALLGLYLGSGTLSIMMIFFASVIGCIFTIPLLASGKLERKAVIPFGPFLIVAAIILTLFGQSMIHWLNTKGIYI